VSDRVRVAVVAGVTGGIGTAVAQTLKRDGFHIVGLSRMDHSMGEDRADPAVDLSLACDLTSECQVSETIDSIHREYETIAAFVNCAGIMRRSPLTSLESSDVDILLNTNLRGTILMCAELVPLMRQQGGSIVNVSSSLARRPVPGTAVYAAAKAGVEAFSRALAVEYAEYGVRVNVVQAALVRTAIWEKGGMSSAEFADFAATRAASYPLGRIGEPSDVAEAAAFLVSERASWITGVVLPVDGGAAL
jgi:NAD(P)-dependent dehydrogenase (short-subunit alcohol dehydrogenase family)